MGVHDRDYMRVGSGQPSYLSGLRTTWWLIGINVGLWVIFAMSMGGRGQSPFDPSPYDTGLSGFFWRYLVLHPRQVFESGQLWQPFTAFWLHDPRAAGHVFWNMLLLYFFGRSVEAYLGRRRYLWLYIGGGLASTLTLIPWSYLSGSSTVALGASGAVYAVMVWLACQEPRRPVYLFFILRMPLWVVVGVVMVGLEVFNLPGNGAAVGHLAGAAWGFAFFHLAARWASPTAGADGPGAWMVKLRSKQQAKTRQREDREEQDVRAQVDALLDRIRDEGIEALTEAEKQFLQRASKRYR